MNTVIMDIAGVTKIHAGVADTDIEAGKQVVLTVRSAVKEKVTVSLSASNALRNHLESIGWSITPGIFPGTHWSAKPPR